jgi:hypothetical protein
MVMFACILGASGILAAAILSDRVDNENDTERARLERLAREVERNSDRSKLAICAVLRYAEDTLKNTPPEARENNPQAFDRFDTLVMDMKATEIQCPPPPDP